MINSMLSIIFLTITSFSACHSKKCSIIGKWENEEDKNSYLIIKPNLIYYVYKTDTVSSNKYQVTNKSCDTNYVSEKVANLEFIAIDDETCYEITSSSDTILVYRHTVSGKLQKFHKIKAIQ